MKTGCSQLVSSEALSEVCPMALHYIIEAPPNCFHFRQDTPPPFLLFRRWHLLIQGKSNLPSTCTVFVTYAIAQYVPSGGILFVKQNVRDLFSTFDWAVVFICSKTDRRKTMAELYGICHCSFDLHMNYLISYNQWERLDRLQLLYVFFYFYVSLIQALLLWT